MRNGFFKIAEGYPAAAESAVRATAVLIADEARARAPRDTGALIASIGSDPLEVSSDVATHELGGATWVAYAGDTEFGGYRPDGRVVDYAIYQEFGTRFQPGTPFFFSSVEALRSSFPDRVEVALHVANLRGAV